jgi:uncharacterized membrane protein YeiH
MSPSLELAAVVVLAMYGVLRGARQGFDAVGTCFLAFVVAFGGGTLRDLLLDRHPVFWIENERLVSTVLGIAVVGSFIPQKIAQIESLLWVPDALGLGLFSVLGAAQAGSCGASPLVAVLMGVITGAFGGVIADVICNELPLIFRSSPLYATCSFVGALTYVLLTSLDVAASAAMVTGTVATFILRVVSVVYNLRLPSVPLSEQPQDP